MFSYGLGDAGTGLVATQLGFYLFPFFTCAAGLPAFAAGSLLMVIKIWDGVNDPLIGWLSDHTKSRWGPRLPWMIVAAIPLGISLAAMWWVPIGSITEKTTYYIAISILLMTAYTSVNLPFSALSTEISKETSIRTRLNAARFTGSIIAGLSGLIVAAGFLSSSKIIDINQLKDGYFSVGKVTGIIASSLTLLACWGLAPFAKKARKPSAIREPLKTQFNRILNNKRFIQIISLYLLLWCGLQLMQTVSLIYLEQVMRVPSEISKWMVIPFQISALAGLQFWSFYSNKYGRIKALNKGGLLWILACLAAMTLPPLSSDFLLNNLWNTYNIESLKFFFLSGIILLVGFGASTAYLIPWSLLPDAIDADPEKPAGIYTAWMVLIQKLGIGISVQLLGLLLTFGGYKSATNCFGIIDAIEQPATAIITIRICMGLIPSLLIVIGLLMMRKWTDRAISVEGESL